MSNITWKENVRSIRSHNRRAQAANPSIMIRMAVTGNDHFTRPCVAFLDDYLMTYTSPRGIEIDIVLLGKSLNLLVLCQIGL